MVLILEHGSDNLRGHLRKMLYEPSVGIFYGKVTSTVRDHIWELVNSENCEATLIYDYPNEQGYKVVTKGSTKRHPVDFDGIMLYEREKEYLTIDDCIAKSDGTLLMDHLYESGYIAYMLLTQGRAASLLKHIAKGFHTSEINALNIISFLVAMHDIGKAHPIWQLACIDSNSRTYSKYKRLNLIEESEEIINEPFRHEVYGAQVFKRYLIDTLKMEKRSVRPLFDLIKYHHQGKNQNRDETNYEIKNKEVWNKIHESAIDTLYQSFHFDTEFYVDKKDNMLLYTIISIMITSDWIASSELVKFTKRSQCQNTQKYFETVSDEIISFFEENDLKHISAQYNNITYKELFDFETPSNTQEKVREVINKHKDSISYILIEDVCGSGKTEAAFYAALELMKIKNKGGIYVGLPTAATSRAMYDRFNSFLEKINILPFGELSEFTSKSFLYRKEDYNSRLWSSPSRQKFLKSSAIGTIDQVMHGIQAYRYGAIRWLGIADKVLIIDELHAYDYYMMAIINELIKWCLWADVPVIMLSATIPEITKTDTYKQTGIYNKELSQEYPLVSLAYRDDEKVSLDECRIDISKSRVVPYELLYWTEDKISTAIDKAICFINQGGCICIILNSVSEAREAYLRLKELYYGELILLHARNTETVKSEVTNDIIQKFGKDAKAKGERPSNAIVISTQMIEASVDVDFDYMITDLAPIDALIQRMGRWHRHGDFGTVRQDSNHMGFEVQILIPSIVDNSTLGSNRIIYDIDGVLTSTIEVLKDKKQIREPEDIRGLIDKVYANSEGMMTKKLESISYAKATLINKLDYDIFNKSNRDTRLSEIEYVDICIIEDDLWQNTIDALSNSNTMYEQSIELLKNNVISIPEYKLRDWKGVDVDEKGILDKVIFVRLYNGTYENDKIIITYERTIGIDICSK